MSVHQVEIDEVIYEFVKSHAEPFVDDFNTALRRLLKLDKPRPIGKQLPAASDQATPKFPTGTPQALRQIIEVATLVNSGSYRRRAATKLVAKRHHVATETVQDKYTRQLGLTARQFDLMLEQAGRADLVKVLKSKFLLHADVIERISR